MIFVFDVHYSDGSVLICTYVVFCTCRSTAPVDEGDRLGSDKGFHFQTMPFLSSTRKRVNLKLPGQGPGEKPRKIPGSVGDHHMIHFTKMRLPACPENTLKTSCLLLSSLSLRTPARPCPRQVVCMLTFVRGATTYWQNVPNLSL